MAQQISSGESLLNIVGVASPCTVSWDSMEGGQIVRFCSQCQMNVYNLSEMPAAAAEQFLQNSRAGEGKTCIRFYRRHDGTLITRDCPVGVASLKAKAQRLVLGAASVAASLFLVLLGGCQRGTGGQNNNNPNNAQGNVPLLNRLLPGTGTPAVVMGDMCLPPTPGGTTALPAPGQPSRAGNDLEISLE